MKTLSIIIMALLLFSTTVHAGFLTHLVKKPPVVVVPEPKEDK